MTILKALLKFTTLSLFLFVNYFAFLEASTLYPNTSHVNVVCCIEKERRALLKFKEDAVDYFGLLSSWYGVDCCTWKGVSCRYPTSEVVKLHLAGNFLGGKISNHLSELTHLRYLNLSNNEFSGMIPPRLGNLSNLHVLDLGRVGYDIFLHDLNWISSLSSLKYLDLTFINVSLAKTHWLQAINAIPSLEVLRMLGCYLDTIPLSLSQFNLTSLSVLDLSRNYFNSPVPRYLSDLSTNLEELSLNFCGFTFPISSLEHLKSLRRLGLSSNFISSSLLTSIGKLSKLEYLNLSSNNINGSVPKSFGRLTNLKFLDVSWNEWEGTLSQDHFEYLSKLRELYISSSGGGLVLNVSFNWVPPFSLIKMFIYDCDVGPKFPKWLQTQTQIEFLTLQNASISDTIPDWLLKVSPHLELLRLSDNQLGGSIPSNIGQMMPSIRILDLSSNSLNGTIPISLRKMCNLLWLSLSNNQLGGSIPFNIGQMMPSIRELDLSSNSLNGTIPLSLGKMSNLTRLSLSNNHISGKIHDKWPNNLALIDFSNNNLSGKIPSSLLSSLNLQALKLSNNSIIGELPTPLTSSSKDLWFVDLGDNKLSGSISEWIGEGFTSLAELRMRGNMFNGSISDQYCRLQKLRLLDLAQNNLSGPIPVCLSRLSAMYSINGVNRFASFGMDLNLKGNKYSYDYPILPQVRAIDLSCNHLSGIIPEDITNLKGLNTLNLSNNHLTGNIPSRIGDMQNLETLDLSSNQIYGQIPPSLSSMTALSHLNLSHNNLSGPIPSSTQLSTFDETVYEGNSGLCGSPLSKCGLRVVQEEGGKNNPGEDDTNYRDGKLGLYLSIAVGFVFGFWCICGTLVAKKSWRRTYFGFIDKTMDRIALIFAMNLNRFYKMIAKKGTN